MLSHDSPPRVHTPLQSLVVFVVIAAAAVADAQVLDQQQQLDAQTFWDNRDWDWYKENIPFFECPDADITTTYYYRWELLTKHLTYGSPDSGYSFTEFIDRPFWSGAYGAISCPAGHQLYEARWLRSPRIANDYTRYWLRTPGSQPRNYSTWLADAAWAVHQVHHDDAFLLNLLPELVSNYEGWEERHFVPEVGLFWQTGHDDGMEFNINSRQTQDILRGAPGFRPSFNAYMWADAVAIAKIARLARENELAERFDAKAASLKANLLELLWDERRQFFFPMYRDDEERDGFQIQARTLTYETGQFAGDSHGRELIGYVPWQFRMIDRGAGYDAAWEVLMDPDGFFADYGPTTVERHDPMFLLQPSCCWWSGQSWPYATTQTLKALANVLQLQDRAAPLSSADYLKLLQIYARSHRKDGRPYLAEALHPDTGSFEGHDAYNHSEHYFHSGFCDLVITGLVGLTPRDDGLLEINPLAPADWEYFALDDVSYCGRQISVVWDRTGQRYNLGQGLRVLVDGEVVAMSPRLGRLIVEDFAPADPVSNGVEVEAVQTVNFAVNNDGTYYPRLTASYSSFETPIGKLNDGNYWYLQSPPNRWTCAGSPNDRDWIIIDFGTPRSFHTIKLYVLDDEGEQQSLVSAPQRIEIEVLRDGEWQSIPNSSVLSEPTGHRPAIVQFDQLETSQLRVTLHHRMNTTSGLTEIEVWGDTTLPLAPVPPPSGNLAYKPGVTDDGSEQEFPKASASHTSRFDRVEFANDGITNFQPNPNNRWTSYESTSPTDWLEIDFGRATEFRRVELALYDDRGGVQAPEALVIQYWTGTDWHDVSEAIHSPARPTGGQWNEVRFTPVVSSKVRTVFAHHGDARSGVTEVMVWND